MEIVEFVPPADITGFLTFHKRLNPKLWEDNQLRPDVRVHLLRTALAFYRFLEVDLPIDDVIFTGSNAAYNYTPLSDIDLHLIVDFAHSACPDLATNFFMAKRGLWGKTHDVTIRGYNVEVYVEDTAKPVQANGVYSIIANTWQRTPQRIAPRYDDASIVAKTDEFAAAIDELEAAPDAEMITDIMARLRSMRQAGLARGGEWSVENCVFKSLRNVGYLTKLRDLQRQAVDQRLSLG